jgi:hypothetical protein
MKRFFGALMALIVATGALVPATASAQRYYHHYYYGHRGHGDAVAAGVVGLALGAIIGSAAADSHRRYYDRGYYDRGYYGRGYYEPGYYEGYDDGYGGPALCVVREHRYDPYSGRDIFIEERRPC